MDYIIFIWDMRRSTEAIYADEAKTLEYLATIAQFSLELTSELPQAEVVGLGDGQQVTMPLTDTNAAHMQSIAQSIIQYSESLEQKYPDYAIRGVLAIGALQELPMGNTGKILWRMNDALVDTDPGTYTTL